MEEHISLIHVDRQFQSIKREVLASIENVLNSGQYILGKEVEQFELEVGQYLNTAYSVSVANGTDALVLSLKALGIGKGDEVITTPFTFFATAEAISRIGAKPVFVDIDQDSLNIDASYIEAAITSRTKAILPVHLFGLSCDINKVCQVAKKHNLFVVEDACQAFGATNHELKLGTVGDIGCYSFFPTKNLSSIGDGGLVVTNNEEIARKIKKLRHHGSTRKYYHDEIGYNSRLDEIHAAILRICLKKIDLWNSVRIKRAKKYQSLDGINGMKTPKIPASNGSHIYHLYCIEHDHRDDLMDYLKQHNIASGIYYPIPLHLQEVYKNLGYKKGDFPVSEQKADVLLALPMHPFLSDEEQDRVIKVLQAYKEPGKDDD
ncbi:DegT/DnrJ/EryC1/StrS family aminotransferase [Alkalihalophilus lindianensis]|uniref:DegT/DnrJ/EryC1/StrS family aminotransferase n=1 Tax=Alkalihalophilus lindianensis TaxID=1630542 RepID=A0ABU3XB34_9BACI|nr:DegT/DnrJ/EryC1/StrS family aminotransferase [Alkalihalophilus lindianensis]MDV2685095.1 DegT/DnrJ/EryC1/StrS family aminotransferase [Alkalihalophilus lindianensis]